MPITWQVDKSDRIHVVFAGPYTRQESEKVMEEVYAERDISRPLRFLVDVRQSAPPDTEFVVNAITFWQMHISDMWGARIAVITATDGQRGMADVSEQAVEWRDLPFALRAFRETEFAEATEWLDEREPLFKPQSSLGNR